MSTPAIVLAIAASLALALTPVLPDLGVRTGAEVDFAVLDGTQRIPAQALSAADWADRRDQLYQLWEVASAEAPVERRFALAVELGRTAALASEPVPPFFEGRENVFYRTARALDDAEGGRLVAAIGDPALAAAVSGRDPASPVAVGFMEEVDAVSGIPWNALTEDDWADRAERLLEGYRTHRDQLSQKQLMVALAQMGRSAENANQGVPPFYGPVPGHEGGPAVNRAWYAAAMLEMAQPELVEKVSDLDVRASILQVVRMVEQGRLPAGSYRDVFVE